MTDREVYQAALRGARRDAKRLAATAAFLLPDSEDIENAIRGATDATDEVPDDLDRNDDEHEE